MSRIIDYALTRDLTVLKVTAHGKRGSDHRLVIFHVLADGVRFRIGLWNVRRDRGRRLVPELAARVVRLFDLDALALCEAQDYARGLARVAHRDRLRLVQWTDTPGQAHQAILVPRTSLATRPRLKLMTRSGWRTVRGSVTDSKWMPSVRVVKGGASIRVGVGHRPPTQRWRRGVMRGPVLRVRSTIQHAMSEVRWLRSTFGPVLMCADFNAEPGVRGRWSPRWVASVTGCTIAAPERGTHG